MKVQNGKKKIHFPFLNFYPNLKGVKIPKAMYPNLSGQYSKYVPTFKSNYLRLF